MDDTGVGLIMFFGISFGMILYVTLCFRCMRCKKNIEREQARRRLQRLLHRLDELTSSSGNSTAVLNGEDPGRQEARNQLRVFIIDRLAGATTEEEPRQGLEEVRTEWLRHRLMELFLETLAEYVNHDCPAIPPLSQEQMSTLIRGRLTNPGSIHFS